MIYHDIVGLDVSMHDAFTVAEVESLRAGVSTTTKAMIPCVACYTLSSSKI